MASHIAQRNNKVMKSQEEGEEVLCRCKEKDRTAFGRLTEAEMDKNKNECPLRGECQAKEVVYQAIVTSGTEKVELLRGDFTNIQEKVVGAQGEH